MADTQSKKLARSKRHKRVRRHAFGTSKKPRLCIFRSNQNIYVQAIDDTCGKVIACASTIDSKLKKGISNGSDKQAAEKVGALIAERLTGKKIKQVTFDRGGYLYCGRVKALADSARKSGLEF